MRGFVLRALCLGPFVFAAACSTPSSAPESALVPFEAHEWFATDYRGRVGVGEGLSEPEAVPAPAPGGTAEGLVPVLVAVSLWRVEGEVARSLLSEGARALEPVVVEGGVTIGGRVDADDLSRRIRDLEAAGFATLVHEPTFQCDPGRIATASVIESAAYVRAFDVHARPSAVVVDPVIDVVRSGMVWTVHCERHGESAIDLRVGFTAVEGCADLQTLEGRLLRGARFAVQSPLQFRQDLSARTVLEASEGMLLSGVFTTDGDAQLIALITARDAPSLR